MLHKFGWILLAVCAALAWLAYDPPPQFFNSSGILNKRMKVFIDTVTLNGANVSANISSAGFNTILSVQLQAEYNTSTAGAEPFVDIKSYTTSSVSINSVQANSQVIGILGINVVGLTNFAAPAGARCHLMIIGY